jgi:hypothetical protein
MTADAAMVIFSSTIEEESAISLITDNRPQLAVKNSLWLLDLHARSIPSINCTAMAGFSHAGHQFHVEQVVEHTGGVVTEESPDEVRRDRTTRFSPPRGLARGFRSQVLGTAAVNTL